MSTHLKCGLQCLHAAHKACLVPALGSGRPGQHLLHAFVVGELDAGARRLAAVDVVNEKRARYPPSGGELVPLAFEDGGRLAEETVCYVRSLVHGLPLGQRSEIIRYAWQQLP